MPPAPSCAMISYGPNFVPAAMGIVSAGFILHQSGSTHSAMIKSESNPMERASSLVRKLSASMITSEELALAAWPDAVGKRIAAHTRAAKLVRTRLVVEVEDAVWQRQLFSLSRQI